MIVIGHRGASGLAPENTLASMILAIEQGCKGIETDLQLTKDGKVVVFHDWSVERTTDGVGQIKDLTFKELAMLDAGSWFSEEFKGERIISLEELLINIPTDLLLNLELKSRADDSRGLERRVMEILEKNNRIDNTIISSFNHISLERVNMINKDIKIALLYEAYLLNLSEYVKNMRPEVYSVHPGEAYVNEQLIDEIHNMNLKTYVWTVNDRETARKLREYGVDGIITNYPDLLN